MKIKQFLIMTLALVAIVIVSCDNAAQMQSSPHAQVASKGADSDDLLVGKQVPAERVCMVNDAFMSKKQIPVAFNGKVYYGCCNMCVERIPKDASVRTAVDPVTSNPIDKADAFIVLLNEDGKVAYFESENTYKQFIDRL